MTMPETDIAPKTDNARRRVISLFLGAIGVTLIAVTLMLWAHYGTAVFLETIRAGIATCFG